MAQESWKVEAEETGCQAPEPPILCSNNCGFFGSATTMNLCSQCYRDVLSKQVKAAEAAAAISAVHSLATAVERQENVLKAEMETSTQSSVHVIASSSDEFNVLGTPDQLPKPNRCAFCNKTVGLTGFKCRCGGLFCARHRYNDMHNCSFDYRAAGRDAILKANPVVKAEKIDKI